MKDEKTLEELKEMGFTVEVVGRNSQSSNVAETILEIVAYILLILGLIFPFIMIVVVMENPYAYPGAGAAGNGILIALAVLLIVAVLGYWAFFKVFVNISRTLKRIEANLSK